MRRLASLIYCILPQKKTSTNRRRGRGGDPVRRRAPGQSGITMLPGACTRHRHTSCRHGHNRKARPTPKGPRTRPTLSFCGSRGITSEREPSPLPPLPPCCQMSGSHRFASLDSDEAALPAGDRRPGGERPRCRHR
jgi:hypothetical protein